MPLETNSQLAAVNLIAEAESWRRKAPNRAEHRECGIEASGWDIETSEEEQEDHG
jgi:hypothetical protein